MKNKNGIPILNEVAEDKLFREHAKEFSKFPVWDKMHSEEYTSEDREVDRRIWEELGK